MVLWAHRDLSLSQPDLNDRVLKHVKDVVLWEARKFKAEKLIREAEKEKDFSKASDMKKSATESLSEANRQMQASQKALCNEYITVKESSWIRELAETVIAPNGTVNLENCCICYASLNEILPMLKGKELEALILDGNGFGDEGLQLIRANLSSGELSIKRLSMRNTSLTTDGIVALCGTVASIPASSELSTVDISSNGLSHKETVSVSVSSTLRFNPRVSISF
jgi:hypothetical protein